MARNTNGAGFSLKDELFNKKKIAYLAGLFKAADNKFPAAEFEAAVMKQLARLALKERIVHIATVLENYLDKDFKVAAKQIQDALPPPLDPTKIDDDFGDFIFAPLGEYVVRNGLGTKHLKTSLKTLREITQRFSMEDAIRYFINEFPDETLAELEKWSTDTNYHVRRLVSEGTRALLPWSGRLKTDPVRPLSFLDTLHADQTRYVTRSVANHMNDIAKLEPDLVIKYLKKWYKAGKQNKKELDWMTRHSLRTLVKQGNQEALELIGYKPHPKIVVSNLVVNKEKVKVGEAVEFSFVVTAQESARLLIDYVIDFVKANGATKPKVHKLKSLNLKKGESITINKKHPFRKNATTLTFYPGVHTITLQINGQLHDSIDFSLE